MFFRKRNQFLNNICSFTHLWEQNRVCCVLTRDQQFLILTRNLILQHIMSAEIILPNIMWQLLHALMNCLDLITTADITSERLCRSWFRYPAKHIDPYTVLSAISLFLQSIYFATIYLVYSNILFFIKFKFYKNEAKNTAWRIQNQLFINTSQHKLSHHLKLFLDFARLRSILTS